MVFDCLPKALYNAINMANIEENAIEEIRLRLCKTTFVHIKEKVLSINYIPEKREFDDIMQKLCQHSYYAFTDEISRGFITIDGGHRVGICGTAVVESGSVINIKDITSLNFRVSKQIYGVADEIMKFMPSNTLIISPPNYGKTTILRDLACQLGDIYKVCIIDERGEISATTGGTAQFDVGEMTDVLNLCPKHLGCELALRSMSPEIIIMDELAKSDIVTIKTMLNSGVKIIATAHGYDVCDTLTRLDMDGLFKHFVVLDKHKIKYIQEM